MRLADGELLEADAVVVNADVAAVAGGLLGSAVTGAVPATPRSARSLSAVTWTLLAEVRGFPLLRHTVFFSRNYGAEFEDILQHRTLPRDPTVYVCAQDRSDRDEPAPPGPERILCLVNAPPDGDSHLYGPEEIQRCATRTLRCLERCGLDLRSDPATAVVTTPSDFARLFPGTGGALYGQASHGWKASFERPAARSRIPRLYLAGGSTHPGPGVPMAALSGRMAAREPALGPHFDQPVARDGYAWWYLDALSDDGRYGLTLIAFIGSVFSPYYALARRRGRGDPQHHCAVNVALYGTGGRGWAMTERGRGSLSRTASTLTIGRSTLAWDGSSLLVEIDEVTAPLPSRIRGRVRLHPAAVTEHGVDLDGRGRHRWWPIAPKAEVEVALDQPSLRWSGTGYLDTNSGDEPLEAGFTRWDWSRAPLRRGTAILYDAERRDGTRQATALHCHPSGAVEEFDPPPEAPLPRTFWRVARGTRADAGHGPTVAQTLEDAPFYARSVLRTHLLGEPATAMHESLSLDRFPAPWSSSCSPSGCREPGAEACGGRHRSCPSPGFGAGQPPFPDRPWAAGGTCVRSPPPGR